ncbi:MAG TPA: hypothetical protein PLN21_00715 [Gemmatales bacterium]|nr:hypothetical protein [Gemmatales bacterium]
MRRAILTVLVGITLFVLNIVADDSKGGLPNAEHGIKAAFVSADIAKNMITFKTSDKAGKMVEVKLELDKNAKIYGTDNKSETLAAFSKAMESKKNKAIFVVEDKDGKHILELKDNSN